MKQKQAHAEKKHSSKASGNTAELEAEQAEPKKLDISTGDIDGLLADIDEVLEENAEEFVRSYIQKGGQ